MLSRISENSPCTFQYLCTGRKKLNYYVVYFDFILNESTKIMVRYYVPAGKKAEDITSSKILDTSTILLTLDI